MFAKILRGEQNPVPKSTIGIVDVRDVARAHVLCITERKAKGHRFITQNGSHWRVSISKILAEKYSSQGWPIVTAEGPDNGD